MEDLHENFNDKYLVEDWQSGDEPNDPREETCKTHQPSANLVLALWFDSGWRGYLPMDGAGSSFLRFGKSLSNLVEELRMKAG